MKKLNYYLKSIRLSLKNSCYNYFLSLILIFIAYNSNATKYSVCSAGDYGIAGASEGLTFNGSGILDLISIVGINSSTDNIKSSQNLSNPMNGSSSLEFENAETSLIFSEDFEGGVMTLPCSGNCPTITTSPVRAGKYAMKTYLHYINSPFYYRTEIQLSDRKYEGIIGGHYWYGFSVYLPNDYIPDNTWEIVAQWHGWPDGYTDGDKVIQPGEESWRSPILSIKTTGGKWSIRNRSTSIANTQSSKMDVFELGIYETGKWVDWVFHMKWSYESDGVLEVWKDGELVVNKQGANCYNDRVGPYFKMGMYKGWKEWWLSDWRHDVVDERTVYHDELRIAHGSDGFDLVSPVGTKDGFVPTPTETRTATGTTFIGEKIAFLDAESGVNTMLSEGVHTFNYTYEGIDKILIVTIIGVPRPLTIIEVQGEDAASPWLGTVVKVTGTVTHVVNGAGFFMQDGNAAWSGISVKTSQTSGIQEGQGVEVTGTVLEDAQYFINVTTISATEIKSITSNLTVEAISVGSPAEAENEKYESVLISITGVTAKAVDPTTGAWVVYIDSSNDILVNDWFYSFTPTVGNKYNVTGIVNGQGNNYRLEPRKDVDIVCVAETTVDLDSVTCNLAVKTNVIQGDCSSLVEILVTGGVAPYVVTVNDNKVTDMVQTLAAGSYEIIVTDANLVCIAETTVDIVTDPVNARTVTDTTFIGERVEFFDSESGVDTMLAEGMHTLNYTYEGCDRTLIVTIVGILQPLTIIEVQGEGDTSPWLGAVVKVAGTVTHVVIGEGFFMQDGNAAWSGISVKTSQTSGIQEGQGVEVTGTVLEDAQYFINVTTISATEIKSITSNLTVEAISVGSPAETENEKYESVLISITSVTAKAVDPTTGAWVVYIDSSNDILVNNWFYSFTPTVGNKYNVTGIVNGQGNNYRLEPRKDVDIVCVAETTVDLDSITCDLAIETNITQGKYSSVVEIVVIGGVPPYKVTVNGTEVTDMVQTLAAGSYKIVATDANLVCVAETTVDVDSITCDLAVETNVIQGKYSSVVEIVVIGGVPPYKVTVNGTEVTDMVQTLATGSYKIVATDANLVCVAETTVDVDSITCDLAVETSVVQGECSSVVEIIVTGGVAPYEVTVNGTKVTDMVQTLAPGSYEIVVTDANLVCVTETTVDIVAEPVKVRTSTDTTFIGERVEFFDAESGVNTMLAEGKHTFNYTYEGCDRTLIATIVGVPRSLAIIEVQGEDDTSPWLNAVVKVAGTVTHVVNGTGFFMQDASVAWGGIWITTTETTGILEGKGVKVTGTVDENTEHYESVTTINATETTLVTSGLTFEAIVVASPAAAEDEKYESVLITVEKARAMEADTATGAWVVYTNDNSDVVVNDRLYSYTPTVGNLYNVTGIVNGQYDSYKLEPRKDVDVVDLTITSVVQTLKNEQFKVYPNPFNDKINIDNNKNLTRIVVSNIAGQRVIDVEYPAHEILTDNLVSGIYVVSLFTENGIAKSERIVKR